MTVWPPGGAPLNLSGEARHLLDPLSFITFDKLNIIDLKLVAHTPLQRYKGVLVSDILIKLKFVCNICDGKDMTTFEIYACARISISAPLFLIKTCHANHKVWFQSEKKAPACS